MSNWMHGLGKKNGCHTGNPVVFEVDGITVHGGGTSRQGGWERMEVTPDLAMGPRQVMSFETATKVPDGFSCASHVGGDTPLIISIDWPDFGIPTDVGREFWLALVEDIKRLGIKTISTQCVGGHGRTGVQLAILAHMLGAIEKPDAYSLIKWVQSNYCHHAVETSGQQRYVAEMCELPVGEELFASVKKKSNFQLSDEPIASSYWGKSKPRIIDDDVDYEQQFMPPTIKEDEYVDFDGMPINMEFYACNECEHTLWHHMDDPALEECPECKSIDITRADNALFEMANICPKCDNTISYFGMAKDSDICLACDAEERGRNVKNGHIECKGSKEYCIPEFIDTKSGKCYGVLRDIKIKREAKKADKKNKGKGKRKGKGRGKHKGKNKGRHSRTLDEWI